MERVRDRVAAYNERLKLLATTFNALAIGTLGYAVLRPVVEDPLTWSPVFILWGCIGLALHLFAHYILSMIVKETSD